MLLSAVPVFLFMIGITAIEGRIEMTKEGMRKMIKWIETKAVDTRSASAGPNNIVEFAHRDGDITKWGPFKMTFGRVEVSEVLNHVPSIPNEDQGKMIRIIFHDFELSGELHVTKENPRQGKHSGERLGTIGVSALPGQVFAVTLSFVKVRSNNALDHVQWPSLDDDPECHASVSVSGKYHDGKGGKEDPEYKVAITNRLREATCRALAVPSQVAMEEYQVTGNTNIPKYALYKLVVDSSSAKGSSSGSSSSRH